MAHAPHTLTPTLRSHPALRAAVALALAGVAVGSSGTAVAQNMANPAAARSVTVAVAGTPAAPAATTAPAISVTPTQVQGTLAGPAAKTAAKAAVNTVGCLIGPMRVADIGSPVTGIVERMAVDVGDSVKAGQPMVMLRTDVEAAGERAAHARWSQEADVRAAEANLQLARQRATRAVELQGNGFVSHQAVEQARTEQQVAEQRLAQSRGQRQVLATDLDVVKAQISQRTVRAPFDGVVLERFRHPGERVEDRPVLRVATLDPLRVDLVVPATRYGQYSLNDRVNVVPELPGAAAVYAQVTHIDRVIDAASNTYRVRLSLPNPGHRLPAGARCTVDSTTVAGAPAAAPAPAPAPTPTPTLTPSKAAALPQPSTRAVVHTVPAAVQGRAAPNSQTTTTARL
jgi:RND family efflux transporter MFP subunit